MSRFVPLLTVALVALLAACAGLHVKVERARGVDFGAFETWAFAPRSALEDSMGYLYPGSPLRVIIEQTLANRLGEQGLHLADPELADVHVGFDLEIVRVVKTYTSVRDAKGDGRVEHVGRTFGEGGGMAGNTTQTKSYHQGTLSVDLHPGRGGPAIWSASAHARILSESSFADSKQRLSEVLDELLCELPTF